MSQQFLYVQFKVTAKGTLTRATGSETVAIELPAKHVAGWKLRHPGRYLTDKEIAIELTQGVAIAAADSSDLQKYNLAASYGLGYVITRVAKSPGLAIGLTINDPVLTHPAWLPKG